MDRLALQEKVTECIKKYRYAILILLIGVFLMLLPTGKKPAAQAKTETVATAPQSGIQEDLQEILSQIQGAGKVRVMLSVAKGETAVYQTDTDTSGGENGITKVETVIITGADRDQSALVQHMDPPIYQGAVVVCQGADSPSVRLALTQAVSSITGLGADKISVLKMK